MRRKALVNLKVLQAKIGLAIFILLIADPYQNAIAQSNVETTATQINNAYQSFLAGELTETVAIMESLDMVLTNRNTVELKPSGVLDSLIFEQEGAKAIFTAVDIDYLKNVKVILQIKTTTPGVLLNEVKSLFDAGGYSANSDFSIPNLCAVFEDKGNHWVVDKRYAHWTYTNFESLYEHVMTIYEDELVLSLSETIPDTWVDDDEFATLSPAVAAVQVKNNF